ncbi:MAG: hypothetical protein KAI83_20345, partial [Thiomargarita sp.]|nr:hypothetical protein [Thiomargarita sp.]
ESNASALVILESNSKSKAKALDSYKYPPKAEALNSKKRPNLKVWTPKFQFILNKAIIARII